MPQARIEFNHFDELERKIERVIERVIIKYTLLIERDAKRNAPVDTGRLRSSIRHELEKLAGTVLAGGTVEVGYAHHVEFGTSNMAAQPYLFPAYEAHRRRFMNELVRQIKKIRL